MIMVKMSKDSPVTLMISNLLALKVKKKLINIICIENIYYIHIYIYM